MFGKHSSISSKPRLQACAPKLQEHGTNSIHKTVIHQPIKQKTTFTPTIKQPISSIPLSSHRREKSIKPSLSHRNGRSMLSPSERSISTNFSSSIFRPSSVSTQPQISQQSTTKTSTSPLGPAVTIPIRTDWQNVYLRKRRRRRRRRKRRRAVRPAQLYRRPPTEDEEFMSDHERMVYYSRRYRLGAIENAEPYGTPMMEKFGFRFDTHIPTYAPQEGDIKQMQEILQRADDELAFNRPYVQKYRDYKEAAYSFVPHTADETGLYAKNMGDFFTVPFKYRFTKWYQDAVDNYNRMNETRIVRNQKDAVRLSFDHVRRRNWFQRVAPNPTSWHVRAFIHQRFPMLPILTKRWIARSLDVFLWFFPRPKWIRRVQKSTGMDSRLAVSGILLFLLLALLDWLFHPSVTSTDEGEAIPVEHDYDTAINSETRRYIDRLIEVETAYVYAKSLLDMHDAGLLEDPGQPIKVSVPAELVYRLELPDSSMSDDVFSEVKEHMRQDIIQHESDEAAHNLIYPGVPRLRGGNDTPDDDLVSSTASFDDISVPNSYSFEDLMLTGEGTGITAGGNGTLTSGGGGYRSTSTLNHSSSSGGHAGISYGVAASSMPSLPGGSETGIFPDDMVGGDDQLHLSDPSPHDYITSGGGYAGSDDNTSSGGTGNLNNTASRIESAFGTPRERRALTSSYSGKERVPSFVFAREARKLGHTVSINVTLKQFLDLSTLQLENELTDYKKYFARRSAPVTQTADNFYNVIAGTYTTLLNRDVPSFTPLLSSLHQAMIDFGVRLRSHDDSSTFPLVKVDEEFIERVPTVEIVEEVPPPPPPRLTDNPVINSIQDFLDEEVYTLNIIGLTDTEEPTSMSKVTENGNVITVTELDDHSSDTNKDSHAATPPKREYLVRLPFVPSDLSTYTHTDYQKDLLLVDHIKSCKVLENRLPDADHALRKSIAYDMDTLRGDPYGQIGRSISSRVFADLQKRYSHQHYKKALELELEVMTEFKDHAMARYKGKEPVWISAVNPVKLIQWKDYVANVAEEFYNKYLMPLPTRLDTPLLPLPGEKNSMGYDTKLSDTLESHAAHVRIPEFLREKLARVYNPRTLDDAPKPLTFDLSLHLSGDSQMESMIDRHYEKKAQSRLAIMHKLQFSEVSKRRNWKEWQQYKHYRNTFAGHRTRTIMEHDRWRLNPWFLKAMRAPPREGYLPPQIKAWSMFLQEVDDWRYFTASWSDEIGPRRWSIFSGSLDKTAQKMYKRLMRKRGNQAFSDATRALEITRDMGRKRILQRFLIDEKEDLGIQMGRVPVLAAKRLENISTHIGMLRGHLRNASPEAGARIRKEITRLQKQYDEEESTSKQWSEQDMARISDALSEVDHEIRKLFEGKLKTQYLLHKESRLEHWNEAVQKESERRAILRLGEANRAFGRFTQYQERGQRIANILIRQGEVDQRNEMYRDYHERRLLEDEELKIKQQEEFIETGLKSLKPSSDQFDLLGEKPGVDPGSYIPFLSRREREERREHDLARAYEAISLNAFERLDFQHDNDAVHTPEWDERHPNPHSDKPAMSVYEKRIKMQKERLVNSMMSQAIQFAQKDILAAKNSPHLTEKQIRDIQQRAYEKIKDYKDWLTNPDKWVTPPRSFHQIATNSGLEIDERVRNERKKRVERLWKGENISSHEWSDVGKEIDRFIELVRTPPTDPDKEPYYALLLEARQRAEKVFTRLEQTPKNEKETERFMEDLDQAVAILEYFDPQTYNARETARIMSDDDAYSFSKDNQLFTRAEANEIHRFSIERAELLRQGRIDSMQTALKVAMVNEEKRAALRLKHGGHRPEDSPQRVNLRKALHLPLYRAEADRTELEFKDFTQLVYQGLLMKGQGDLVDPNSEIFIHTCRYIYNIDRYLAEIGQYDKKNPVPLYKIRAYRANMLDVDTLKALIPYVEDARPPKSWPSLPEIDTLSFDTPASKLRMTHNDDDALAKTEALEKIQAREYYKSRLEEIEDPNRMYRVLADMKFTKHQDDTFAIHDFLKAAFAFGPTNPSLMKLIPQRGQLPRVKSLHPSSKRAPAVDDDDEDASVAPSFKGLLYTSQDGLISTMSESQHASIDEFLAGVPQFDERRVKAMAQESLRKRSREVRLDRELAIHPSPDLTQHPPYREYAKNLFALNDSFDSQTLLKQNSMEARMIGMTQQYHEKQKELLNLRKDPGHVVDDPDDLNRNNPFIKSPLLIADAKRKTEYRKYYSYRGDGGVHPDQQEVRDEFNAYEFDKKDRLDLDNYMLNHPRYETLRDNRYSFNNPDYQPPGSIIPRPETRRRPLLKEQLANLADTYEVNEQVILGDKPRSLMGNAMARNKTGSIDPGVPTPISYQHFNPEYAEQEAQRDRPVRSEVDSDDSDLTKRNVDFYIDNLGNKIMRPSLARRLPPESEYYNNRPITDDAVEGEQPRTGYDDGPTLQTQDGDVPSLPFAGALGGDYRLPPPTLPIVEVMNDDGVTTAAVGYGSQTAGGTYSGEITSAGHKTNKGKQRQQQSTQTTKQRTKTESEKKNDLRWAARQDWIEGVVTGRFPNPYDEDLTVLTKGNFGYTRMKDDNNNNSSRRGLTRPDEQPKRPRNVRYEGGDGDDDDDDDDDDRRRHHRDGGSDDDDDDESETIYLVDQSRRVRRKNILHDDDDGVDREVTRYYTGPHYGQMYKPGRREAPVPSVLFGRPEAQKLIAIRKSSVNADDAMIESAYHYLKDYEDYTNMRTYENAGLALDYQSHLSRMRATTEDRLNEQVGLSAMNFYSNPTLLQSYHDFALEEEIKIRREAYEKLHALESLSENTMTNIELMLPHEREAFERHLSAAKQLCKLKFELPRSERKRLEERIKKVEEKLGGPDHVYTPHELEALRQQLSQIHLQHEHIKNLQKSEQAFEKFQRGERLDVHDQYYYLAHEAIYLRQQMSQGHSVLAGFYNNPAFKKLHELMELPSHEAKALLDRALLTMELNKRERDGIKWLLFNYDKYQNAAPTHIIDDHIDIYAHHLRDLTDFTTEEILDRYDIVDSSDGIHKRIYRPKPLGAKVNSFATNLFDSYRVALALEIARVDEDFKPLPKHKIYFPAINNATSMQEKRMNDRRLALLQKHGTFAPTVYKYNPDFTEIGTDEDQMITFEPHQKHLFSLMFYEMNPFAVHHKISQVYSQRKEEGTEEFFTDFYTNAISTPLQTKIDHVKEYSQRQMDELTSLFKEMQVEDTIKLSKGEPVDWEARDKILQDRYDSIHNDPRVKRLRDLVQVPLHMM